MAAGEQWKGGEEAVSASARRHSDEVVGLPPTPSSSDEFAQLIEASSLSSSEARQARLAGAEVLADYPRVTPWARNAPQWPDIATLDQEVGQAFGEANQRDTAELWLRTALLRV